MARIVYKPGPHLADAFGKLKAQQAALKQEEEALKKAMLKMNQPVITGELFDVTISAVAGRESIDMDRLRKMVAEKIIAACMKVGKPSVRFAAKARVADREAA